jgi:hypothetical protein
MWANVGAIIAWLRASVLNSWLGTPAMNPELEAVAQRRHQQRQTHIAYIVNQPLNTKAPPTRAAPAWSETGASAPLER